MCLLSWCCLDVSMCIYTLYRALVDMCHVWMCSINKSNWLIPTFCLHTTMSCPLRDLGVVELLRSPLLLSLFVSNEARSSSSKQPTHSAPVARHTLMAVDECGVSQATGVRVGRMWGMSRWGLIWLLPETQPLQTSFPGHSGTGQQQTCHLQSHQMKMRGVCYIKSTPDSKVSQRQINHWHLEFVWFSFLCRGRLLISLSVPFTFSTQRVALRWWNSTTSRKQIIFLIWQENNKP